ncbi:MAG: N-acetyltransferase family protein [Pseudomonadales bacterium]|nr:N-acetyltransferase family protein [Pseudomonadales bacterium]
MIDHPRLGATLANKTTIRAAEAGDIPALTEIYNHFVINTHVTFDTEPFSPLDRQAWFDRYQDNARHQLLVAVDHASGEILGYTTSGQLRPKKAYDTSVETTVYLHPENVGQGIGSKLYAALFDRLANEDVHRCYGIIALPNEASIALHESFGFTRVASLTEVGRKFDQYWDVIWMEKSLD